MPEVQNGRIGGGVLKDNLELYQGGLGKDYLNFKNTSTDTALLHLDAVNSRIGINNESPTDVLYIPNEFGSVGFETNYANIDDITIQNSEINSNAGDLRIWAQSSKIVATAIATDDIKIDYNTISTTTLNTNLEIRPDGTGEVNIYNAMNVTGSLHATGDLTIGGNIILGDSPTDSITFDSELASDIIPSTNTTHDIGNVTKRWLGLYTNLVNGKIVDVGSVALSDTSLALRQGNIFYVSVEGDDTNVGDHQHGAFATVERALAAADSSSSGPVTIHIFPGTYEEACPLVVPPHVSIRGEDLRNTIIKPDTSSQSEDIFHLQEDTTIEDITIKDFYYDNLNNTGYAFRFTPGGTVNTRSPYVRNVTVITKGSTAGTDPADPRGFADGDAGKGAWIDGSELDPQASNEASMLFHSCTFITPGVDCITMTNGVRVEWLNCFTYYANRSLYATQGLTGFELPDSTLRYGAEIRAIGSASIYGNYGAVADGASTLMYLINHNMAYIGTAQNSENDPTLVIQENEAVEINSGKIYYTTTDHRGNFRVGDSFWVDFETGQTSFDAGDVTFAGLSSITTGDEINFTYIDGERIDTGNIRISGNTITTIDGELVLSPATGVLNLDTNPSLILPNGDDLHRTEQTADIRYNTDSNLFEGYGNGGNVHFGGVYSDDRQTYMKANYTTGAITFAVAGSYVGQVNDYGIEIHGLSDGDILVDNNLITTTLSNSDLELRRDGTGLLIVDDLHFEDANILSSQTDAVLSVSGTATGYIKFDYTSGLVIPYGTDAQEPISPEIGTTRWNTTDELLEIWDGTSFVSAAGSGASVDEAVLNELLDLYTLVLG